MAFPENLTTRTVVGTFLTPRGVPASGYIIFSPQVALHNEDTDEIVLPSPVKKNLDSTGSFSVELLDTENLDLAPSGWGYKVSYHISGVTKNEFITIIPAGEGSIQFSDLVEIDPLELSLTVIQEILDRLDEVETGKSNIDHTHTHTDVTDLGTAALVDTGTGATNVILGNDARLTDARTPNAHAASHVSAGSDPLTIDQSQVTDLTTDLSSKVEKTTLNANSVLYAVTDDTPAALAVGASTVVGRKATGDVVAMTATEAKNVLAITNTDVSGLGTAAVTNTGTGATNTILGNDARLTDARTPIAHTHPQSDITNLTTDLGNKADLVEGIIPTSQIPSLAINDTFVAANQAAMLALTAQVGDIAIRSDINRTFVLQTAPASTLVNWIMLSGGSDVVSVNGQTGIITLGYSDVGADVAGAAASAQSAAQSYAAALVDDLSGVTNASAARTALGLGTAAVANTGTGASNVILGNDSRLTDTRTPSAASIVDAMIATTLSPSKITGTAAILGANTFTDTQIIRKATSAYLTLDGGSGTGQGPVVEFTSAGNSGELYGYAGRDAAINGGTSTDLLLYGVYGVKVQRGATTLARFGASNNTFSAFSATAIPVIAKGASAQTANLFEAQNSSASVLASISAAGKGSFTDVSATNGTGTVFAQYMQYGSGTGPYIQLTSTGGSVVVRPRATNEIPFVVNGLTSQSVNLQNWQVNGSTLASVSASGHMRAINGTLALPGLAVYTAGSYDSGIQGDASGFYMVAQGNASFRAHSSLGNMFYMKIRPPGDNPASVAFRLQGAASQSANLQTWEDSAGTVLASITAAGRFVSPNGTQWYDQSNRVIILAKGDRIDLVTFDGGSTLAQIAGNGTGIQGNFGITATANAAAVKPLIVKGAASQSANLQEWQNSSATVLASISAAGAGTFNGLTVSAGYTINAEHGAVGTTRYGVNAVNSAATGTGNSAFGYQAATSLTTGFSNVAMGYRALYVNATGNYNTAIGHSTLLALTSGDGNTALGWNALAAATGTTKNTGIGMWAQKVLVSGNYNTTVGAESQYALNGGANNTSVGYGAQQALTTGSGNIALGYLAGMYATNQSNELFINSIDRSNRAGDIAGSIIYGVQDATASNQTLTLNAATIATYGLRLPATSGYGLTLGATGHLYSRKAITNTNWGYSPSYRAIMLGSASTNYNITDGATTLAINYDPSVNSSGSFNGDGSELIVRRGLTVMVPNSGNTTFKRTMTWLDGFVGINQTAPTSGLQVQPPDAASIGLRVLGFASQTANLQEWQNSAGTVLLSVDSGGALVGGSPVSVKLWNRTVQGTGGGSLFIGGSATGSATDCVVIDGNATSFSTGVTSGEWSSLRVGQTNNPNASSTAIHNAVMINPVINYASGGAGAYNALRIKVTETALPSGANYLIYASAGAAGTTEKFSITNAGLGTFAGGVSLADASDLTIGTTTGSKIGQASSKIGFFNATPVAKPTGVAVDAASIHAALVSLGLISA